jgi:hypothetical protein
LPKHVDGHRSGLERFEEVSRAHKTPNPLRLRMSLSSFAGVIEARELSFDEWVEVARPPYGIQELQTLATVYEHYSRYGLGGNSVSLSAVLQREPRSLRAYIRECANSPSVQRTRDA